MIWQHDIAGLRANVRVSCILIEVDTALPT